jgi:hypothetical protein
MSISALLVNTSRLLLSYEPPPTELLTDLVNTLNGYSPDQVQHVARDAKE